MYCFKCNNYVWITYPHLLSFVTESSFLQDYRHTHTLCKTVVLKLRVTLVHCYSPNTIVKKKKKKRFPKTTPLPRYEIVMPQVWISSAIDKTVRTEGKFKCLKCHKTGFGVIFQTFRIWMFILNWSWAAFFLQTRPMESFNSYSHFLSYTHVKIIKK